MPDRRDRRATEEQPLRARLNPIALGASKAALFAASFAPGAVEALVSYGVHPTFAVPCALAIGIVVQMLLSVTACALAKHVTGSTADCHRRNHPGLGVDSSHS